MSPRALLVLVAACLFAPRAWADVSDPHPGIRLVSHGSTAMVVADLCMAGVSVRATKYGERNHTAAGWAQMVDAEVAINADFFDYPGWSYVIGRARGGGEDWPAGAQLKEVRTYWQFGVNQAGLVPNAAVEPGFLITEIVGGHNILIENGHGNGPLYDGDAVLQGAHRRTAVGISADRRYLYLFVSADALNGDGIVWNLVTHAGEAGAPPIHWATNMDGGGSSQLYVKGMGSVIYSSRSVNNHLGIYAKGSGEPWHCNRTPDGWLDAADADGVRGWARDVDVPDTAVDTHVYFGGPALSGAPMKVVKADQPRDDLCAAIGSCAHGFSISAPLSFLDGQPHEIHAYGIDEAGIENKELAGSPKVLQATAPVPTGARRHVKDPASYAAWKLDDFWHRLPVDDAAIDDLAEGNEFPDEPVLVRADDGSPEIWVLDGGSKRHVPDASVMATWSFDFSTVTELPAAELGAFGSGPDWPRRPMLVVRSDGTVFAVDEPLPELGAPPPGQPSSGHRTGSGASGDDSSDGSESDGDVTGGCSLSERRPLRSGLEVLLALACLGAAALRRARGR